MDETFESPFALMGARVRVGDVDADTHRALDRGLRHWRGKPIDASVARTLLDSLRVDVRRDDAGTEYFDVRCDGRVELVVEDVRPDDRHLVLTARVPVSAEVEAAMEAEAAPPRGTFLCGHDEKAWFVAAIPEFADARDVQAAKDALKPEAVWEAIREAGVPDERRDARKTKAFVRQGEWFFIPRPRLKVDAGKVRRDGRIQRGAGRAHVCQFTYEIGGETVYVRHDYPDGLTEKEYRELPWSQQWDRRWHWRWEVRQRDAHVYVKGNIRHPDHKTVFLMDWHEVVPNTEQRARAMSQVAFLD
jgi:hypothetical protein